MNCTARIEQQLDAALRAEIRAGKTPDLRCWSLPDLDRVLRNSCVRPLRAVTRLTLLRRARQRWAQAELDDRTHAELACAALELAWSQSC